MAALTATATGIFNSSFGCLFIVDTSICSFFLLVFLRCKSSVQLALSQKVVDTIESKCQTKLGKANEKERACDNSETIHPCIVRLGIIKSFGDESEYGNKFCKVV